MLSATTLTHSFDVKPSIYAGIVVIGLYSLAILILLLFTGITWLTFPLFILLCGIAFYGAKKAYLQTSLLKVNDAGYVEVEINGEVKSGLISRASYYNGLFISLNIEPNKDDFMQVTNGKSFFIVIYRDAVREFEYRFLARMINFGRD
ncbi:hypothetical protein ACR30L_00535 [Psychromonas sp. PT13]|uniref:hypothetical protein n=1 Tax=Psychromonas sp. PT13 TaxID=3439547 RepID=UPI003EB6D527